MKCLKCGADLYEGVKKCPYCKTPTMDFVEDERFKNFDIQYSISSTEGLRTISEIVGSKNGRKASKKKALFPFKIRRIEKPRATVEKSAGDEAESISRRNTVKSASRSAAEFVPEGLARYTIRDGNNEILKTEAPARSVEKEPISEYTRVRKTVNKAPRRRSMKTRSRRKLNFNFNFNIDKKFLMMGGAALAAVLVVVLCISAIAGLASKSDSVASSYTYVKDNELYMVYKSKTHKISQQVICDSYVRYAEETETAVSPERAAKNEGVVRESKNGKRTYFFDDYNPETSSGALKLVKSGRAKKIIEISPAVHNSLVMSEDGESILYLQTADENGDMGVLYYWNEKLDEPFKIATDIDHGTFTFAGEGKWVMFIQNLNRINMQGDLFAKSLDSLKDEKVKVDSAVCKLYGTSPKGGAYIYAKDYDKDEKSFDIYAMDETGKTIRLGERTKRDPLMQKTKNSLFVYGLAEDGTSNLYTVEIKSGKKERIASGVGSILMLSKNEKTVIYDKVYNGKLADYYAYTKGKQPQIIASNVVVDYNAVAGKPQMAIDVDVSTILYVSEFEAFKGGGTLNLCKYKNGKVVSEEKISEDVYAVYRAKDDKFIIAKDYSTSRKIFDLYLLQGSELIPLKEEVSPERFETSYYVENIYCITGFGIEGNFGNLEKINMKGECETVAEGVFDFDFTSQQDILLYKNLDTNDGKFDMDIRLDGKKRITKVDTAVDEIIGY